jgi:hypothetical protein
VIPRQSAVWDERRNSSQVRQPNPNALRDCLASMASWRENNPEHAQWIADGYPALTEAEHIERFGKPYERAKVKRG